MSSTLIPQFSVRSSINRVAAAGGSVDVDAETASLLNYAATCFRESDGLFDLMDLFNTSLDLGGALPALPQEAHVQLTYRFAVPPAFLAFHELLATQDWRAARWLAGRPGAGTDLALAGELDARPGVDAGRDPYRQRASRADSTLSGALRARMWDDRAVAPALRAGTGGHHLTQERALHVLDVTATLAHVAGDDVGAWLGTGTLAGGAWIGDDLAAALAGGAGAFDGEEALAGAHFAGAGAGGAGNDAGKDDAGQSA